jgi:hypothetical protein
VGWWREFTDRAAPRFGGIMFRLVTHGPLVTPTKASTCTGGMYLHVYST